ncbi:Urocanate hydratase [Streptomyces alboniger]
MNNGSNSPLGGRPCQDPAPYERRAGTELSALGWQQEAALRMLQNNLDPEVAEHPDKLVVYGGTGKAARDWRSFDAMVRTLRTLKQDETMLVQSGRPVGVMQTHEWAPRVLIANSNLVGDWANWEEFRRLEALGLTMYGQMTAGSWIYIGTQGILQGTYETFAAVAAKKFGGTLAGTITLTAGLGGMGGAQPLAVTMNDGVAICIDCDPRAIERRIEHRYLDVKADSLEHALQLAVEARDARRPLSIGLLGNAAELLPRMLAEGAPVDIVTDQTSAHDPLAYLPVGVDFDDMASAAAKDPAGFTTRARESMARHVEAMVGFMDAGAEVFDYGNSIRGEAQLAGYERAFAFPGFVPPTSAPSSARARAPSAGRRCPARPPTSQRPTRRSSTSSPRTSPSPAGSSWPASASTSRACPPASAGSATASGTRPVSGSTTWWPPVSWPPRWPSAATTSTAGRWPPPTARPRPCSTAPTRSPTGRC